MHIGVLQTHVRVARIAQRLAPYHICYICAPKYAPHTVADASVACDFTHEYIAPVAEERCTWRPIGDYLYPPYATAPFQVISMLDIALMQL